jgi:hypothetical protein
LVAHVCLPTAVVLGLLVAKRFVKPELGAKLAVGAFLIVFLICVLCDQTREFHAALLLRRDD